MSGKGEIWEFGFCKGPGMAGIHLDGFVLMSGPQQNKLFLYLVDVVAQFGLIFLLFLAIWKFPLGLLLAPVGSSLGIPINHSVHSFPGHALGHVRPCSDVLGHTHGRSCSAPPSVAFAHNLTNVKIDLGKRDQ